MKFTEIETHRLSDGGLTTVTRAGNQYRFMRSYPDLLTAPDIVPGLTKSEALDLLADTLKVDVMEEGG